MIAAFFGCANNNIGWRLENDRLILKLITH